MQYEVHILGKKKKGVKREEGGNGSEAQGGTEKVSILFWKQQNKYDLEMLSW